MLRRLRRLSRRSLSSNPQPAPAAKRFYKETGIAEETKGFVVTLDGRQLRSPARNALILPTKALALAVAAEWDAQTDLIEPIAMPLMSLAATAVDQVAKERNFQCRNQVYISTRLHFFIFGQSCRAFSKL